MADDLVGISDQKIKKSSVSSSFTEDDIVIPWEIFMNFESYENEKITYTGTNYIHSFRVITTPKPDRSYKPKMRLADLVGHDRAVKISSFFRDEKLCEYQVDDVTKLMHSN
jgi:hypothetical protein